MGKGWGAVMCWFQVIRSKPEFLNALKFATSQPSSPHQRRTERAPGSTGGCSRGGARGVARQVFRPDPTSAVLARELGAPPPGAFVRSRAVPMPLMTNETAGGGRPARRIFPPAAASQRPGYLTTQKQPEIEPRWTTPALRPFWEIVS